MNVGYLACGGWIAAAVGVAARLGIADLLADRPLTSAELAERTKSDPTVLRHVLHLLVEVGVFSTTGEGALENTADSEPLRSDHPRSLRAFCQLAAGDYQRVFQALERSVASGSSATSEALGSDLYTHLVRVPESGRIYDAAMEDLARPMAALIARRPECAAAQSVVDVGGGRGALVAAIVREHPSVRGICVDRGDVASEAEATWRARDEALLDRLTFVGGDFFAHVPAGHDLYLLKNVLHNWSDVDAVRILTSVREAMTADACLLVIESLSDGTMPRLYRALDELLQVVLCQTGSRVRDREALGVLIERAGLAVMSMEPLRSGHTLASARRGASSVQV